MQVFVSFTGDDRDIKNKIVQALRNELGDEYEVFESDEGCTSDFSGESIENVNRSDVFVILLSASSMGMKSSVINELIAAHNREKQGKLNMVAFKLDDAPMPERFQFQMNHISDANHTYSGEDGIPSLVRKVHRLLDRRRLGDPEKPMDIDVPELNGIPIGKTGYFVEHSRDAELEAIEEALKENSFVFCIQLDGYGRKTAVRRYIEKHADRYTKCLYFPQFTGSLWEFLLKGLSIENLDPCVYDELNEMDVVRKKMKYLGNLGRDCLLMVPNVYLDDRDYQPVFDMLGALQCRVILVTQSMPYRYRDAVSQVRVGRMSDESLERLFFHHYEYADEAQQSALRPTLRAFFDAIDGHTKTIELAACVLSDEYLMPDELEQKLSSLSGAQRDELSDRVLDSVVQLFDISGFDETDKRLLLAAALLCELPLAEMEFVRLLKQAGLFSGTSLKKLCDSRWIDKDERGKLLSMSALLANVCLKRLPICPDVSDACLAYLSDSLVDHTLQRNNHAMRMDYLRLIRIWQAIEMPASARLAGLCLGALDQSDAQALPGDWKNTLALAESEQRAPEGKVWESGLELVNYIKLMIEAQHVMELMPLDARGRSFDEALTAKLMDLFTNHDREGFISLFEELNQQDDPELRELAEGLRHLLSATSPGMLTRVFLILCDRLTRSIPEYGEEYDLDLFALILYRFGTGILLPLCNTAYGRLTLLDRLETLLDARGGAFSAADAYLISVHRLLALSEVGDAGEALKEAYADALELFRAERERYYQTPEAACEDFFNISVSFIKALLQGGRSIDADEALRGCRELDCWSADMLLDYTRLLSEVSETLFEEGFRERGVEALRYSIGWICETASSLREDGHKLEDTLNLAAELQDELSSMENPGRGTALEGNTAFRDYYDVYPAKRSNAKRAKVYTVLTKAAEAYDFTSESEERLRSRLEALKRRARTGEGWNALAPEAFALFSEAGRRVLGYPMHGVQMTGAAVVFDSGVAEMQNGEGKTYVIALAAFMHALYGRQVHVLDTSKYLSERNYVWMRGVLEYLGLRVGFLQNYGSFDARLLNCDVLYGELRELLYTTMLWKVNGQAYAPAPLRKDAALIDEADEGLVAQLTDLHVNGQKRRNGYQKLALFEAARRTVSQLSANDDGYFVRRRGNVTLKPAIWELAQTHLHTPIASMSPADQAMLETALRIAVEVMLFFERDRDYFIRGTQAGGDVPMVETVEGALAPLRTEYAYFVWAREKREDKLRTLSLADSEELYTVSIYRLLKEYRYLGGASATAVSLADELEKYYGLEVFRLEPNRACVRTDHPARLYMSKEAKYEAILDLIREKHATMQPILAICENVSESALLGRLLSERGIGNTVLNAANQDENPECLSHAGEKGQVTVTTALANRGVDICLGGDPALRAKNRLIELGVDKEELGRAISGLPGKNEDAKRLKQRYADLRAYYWYKLSPAKAEVESLGGLCVIGTTCFDDLRTEQQARGRSGRQGSPGESWMFYSLDDAPLMELLGDRLKAVRRMYGEQDEGIAFGFLNDSILKARLRRQHMRSDSVMHTPGTLYLYDGLETLLKPVPELSAPDNDALDFVLRHLQQDALYSEEMKLLNEARLTRANSFVLYLNKQGLQPIQRESSRDRLTRLLGFLRDFMSQPRESADLVNQETTLSGLNRFRVSLGQSICRELRNACGRYIDAVCAEIQASGRLGHSQAKTQRHVSEYAESLSARLYSQAVESALLHYCVIEYGSREALG